MRISRYFGFIALGSRFILVVVILSLVFGAGCNAQQAPILIPSLAPEILPTATAIQPTLLPTITPTPMGQTDPESMPGSVALADISPTRMGVVRRVSADDPDIIQQRAKALQDELPDAEVRMYMSGSGDQYRWTVAAHSYQGFYLAQIKRGGVLQWAGDPGFVGPDGFVEVVDGFGNNVVRLFENYNEAWVPVVRSIDGHLLASYDYQSGTFQLDYANLARLQVKIAVVENPIVADGGFSFAWDPESQTYQQLIPADGIEITPYGTVLYQQGKPAGIVREGLRVDEFAGFVQQGDNILELKNGVFLPMAIPEYLRQPEVEVTLENGIPVVKMGMEWNYRLEDKGETIFGSSNVIIGQYADESWKIRQFVFSVPDEVALAWWNVTSWERGGYDDAKVVNDAIFGKSISAAHIIGLDYQYDNTGVGRLSGKFGTKNGFMQVPIDSVFFQAENPKSFLDHVEVDSRYLELSDLVTLMARVRKRQSWAGGSLTLAFFAVPSGVNAEVACNYSQFKEVRQKYCKEKFALDEGRFKTLQEFDNWIPTLSVKSVGGDNAIIEWKRPEQRYTVAFLIGIK